MNVDQSMSQHRMTIKGEIAVDFQSFVERESLAGDREISLKR